MIGASLVLLSSIAVSDVTVLSGKCANAIAASRPLVMQIGRRRGLSLEDRYVVNVNCFEQVEGRDNDMIIKYNLLHDHYSSITVRFNVEKETVTEIAGYPCPDPCY